MGTGERIALAIVGVGALTTAILPDRKTAQVLDAFRKLFRGGLATAMGFQTPGSQL
jgi:hypothetical protein